MRTFERLVRLRRYAKGIGRDFNVECIDITDLAQNRAFQQDYIGDDEEGEEEKKKKDHFGAPGFEVLDKKK